MKEAEVDAEGEVTVPAVEVESGALMGAPAGLNWVVLAVRPKVLGTTGSASFFQSVVSAHHLKHH